MKAMLKELLIPLIDGFMEGIAEEVEKRNQRRRREDYDRLILKQEAILLVRNAKAACQRIMDRGAEHATPSQYEALCLMRDMLQNQDDYTADKYRRTCLEIQRLANL